MMSMVLQILALKGLPSHNFNSLYTLLSSWISDFADACQGEEGNMKMELIHNNKS